MSTVHNFSKVTLFFKMAKKIKKFLWILIASEKFQKGQWIGIISLKFFIHKLCLIIFIQTTLVNKSPKKNSTFMISQQNFRFKINRMHSDLIRKNESHNIKFLWFPLRKIPWYTRTFINSCCSQWATQELLAESVAHFPLLLIALMTHEKHVVHCLYSNLASNWELDCQIIFCSKYSTFFKIMFLLSF